MIKDIIYPEWARVAKDIKNVFEAQSPRFKLESVIEADQKREVRNEPIGVSDKGKRTQIFPHIYYSVDITYSRPDGAKCVTHIEFPYYQKGSEWVQKFQYVNFGSGKLSPPNKKDPMELNFDGALKLVREYIIRTVKDFFPSKRWANYVSSNKVKIIITDVVLDNSHGESGIEGRFEDIDYGNLSGAPGIKCLILGEYIDKNGSFEFSYPTFLIRFYAITGAKESWSLGNSGSRTPLEKLTPDAVDKIKEFIDPKDEPRVFLEQYMPQLSPREKALVLLMQPTNDEKLEGLSVLRLCYPSFINDDEVIEVLIELKQDAEIQISVEELLQYAAGVTTSADVKTLIQDSIKFAADSELKKNLSALDNPSSSAFGRASSYFYNNSEKYRDNKEVISALTRSCLAGQELSCRTLRIMGRFGQVEFRKMRADLNGNDQGKRQEVLRNLASDDRIADDMDFLNDIIQMKLSSKDAFERTYLYLILDFVNKKHINKLTPEMKAKVKNALKIR